VKPLTQDGTEVASLEFEFEITSIAADGKRFAVGLSDKSLTIYTVADGKFEESQKVVTGRVAEALAFSEYEGQEAILMNDGSDVIAYLLADFKKPTVLMGHIATTTFFTVNSQRNKLATCDRDGRIRISKYPQAYDILRFCLFHVEFVTSLAFTENDVLFSVDGDGQIAKWSAEGKLIASKQIFAKGTVISQIAIVDGKVAVIAEKNASISFVDEESLEVVSKIDIAEQPLVLAAIDKTLFVGCNGEIVSIVDGKAKTLLNTTKLDPVPTKENLRVNRKKIVDATNKSSEEYSLWRSPEEAVPSREDE
jgi:WD40 repeat protein